ncbi:MAG: hypothetical protein NC320_08815 [Clostridium sp.]|nr:hypothetical protein [Clostridium sp.]
MGKQIKLFKKIMAIISLIIPLLYFSMYLPIWNGKEIHRISFFIDFIQIIAFVVAGMNLYFIFIKKRMLNQIVFILSTIISAVLLCFFGIFFIENLMGIPPFPPQN